MPINLQLKKPIIPNSPHFISINILEISNINLQLKEEIFIFDIDGTIYSDKTYLINMVKESELLLSKYLNISIKEAKELHFKKHKETKSGIKTCLLEFQIPLKFIIELHLNLINKKLLKPDNILKDLLLKLSKTKSLICFSNGTEINARYILESIGIIEVFDLIIINDYGKLSIQKPQQLAYDTVNKALNLFNKKVVFFDDEIENYEMGKKVGWESYLIKPEKNLNKILNEIINLKMKKKLIN